MNEDIWMCANEVQIGDDVWEHGVVRTISTANMGIEMICFNRGLDESWNMHPKAIVKVTNR